jgi:hypothetical protein
MARPASDNTAAVWKFLRGKGFTPAQTAGIIGGLKGESGPGLNPSARNPSSGAIGIGQWLGGRARGVRPGDLRGQLQQSFLGNKNADVLDFAAQAKGLADVPGTTSTQTERLPGSSSGGGSGSASFSTPPTQSGVASFEGKKVAAWIKPALVYARNHGWKGQVNSGYRSFADQTRIYNSGVRPAAKPGTSNHGGSY